MLKSNVVLFVLCVTSSYTDALDNYIHHRHRLLPADSSPHHIRLHKRSLQEESRPKQVIAIPAGYGQPRTDGLIDKISDGIAQGLSKGLSSGITDGITGSIYALPNAIQGSLNSMKSPNYVSGSYSPSYTSGSQFSQYYPAITQGYGSQFSQYYPAITQGYGSQFSQALPYSSFESPSYLSQEGSYSLGGGYPSGSSFYLPFSGSKSSHHSKTGHYTIPSYSTNHGATGAVYAIPSYSSKPAPAYPHHWDCKLVPASYGHKLFKSASGDAMEDQAYTLGQLIQSSGQVQGGYQVARSNSNIMATGNNNVKPAMLEEKNLPPSGVPQQMIAESQGTHPGSNPNVVLLLVPVQGNQNQQVYHQQQLEQHHTQDQNQKPRQVDDYMQSDQPIVESEMKVSEEKDESENFI